MATGLVFPQNHLVVLPCNLSPERHQACRFAPLEAHTLVHAGCAMTMYRVWFREPLGVRSPTLIPTAGIEHTVALMAVQSRAFCSSRWNRPNPCRDEGLAQPIEMNSMVTLKLPTEADYMMMDSTTSAPLGKQPVMNKKFLRWSY